MAMQANFFSVLRDKLGLQNDPFYGSNGYFARGLRGEDVRGMLRDTFSGGARGGAPQQSNMQLAEAMRTGDMDQRRAALDALRARTGGGNSKGGAPTGIQTLQRSGLGQGAGGVSSAGAGSQGIAALRRPPAVNVQPGGAPARRPLQY